MTASQVALESIRWYLVLSALGWLMFPFIFRLLKRLPSRGIPLARPIGLLLAAIVPWWLSAVGLVGYTTPLIIALPVLLALGMWTREARIGELWQFLKDHRVEILVFEVVTILLFAGYVVFRCYNPAIQHTEKPMELTFLTSILHTQSMPPADPWFLGKTINYYYLGYLLMALPARIANIPASHAFNLALATLFATATVAAAGVASDTARSLGRPSRRIVILTGALAGIFLVGIGNLVTPIAFIEHPLRTLHAGWWQGIGWNASRVISDGPNQQTINEFPAFSFVLGDLHPHVLDYPMFISSIGIGLALALARNDRRTLVGGAALGGVLSAALYATNSWDMPPAMLLALAGILIATMGRPWLERLVPVGVLGASAIVTVLPFWTRYVPAVGLQKSSVPASIGNIPIVGKLVETVGVVTWPRTSTLDIFKVHGLFLAIIGVFLASIAIPIIRQLRISPATIVGIVGGLFVLSVVLRFPGLFWFIGPMLLCGSLLLVARLKPSRRYHLSIITLAFLLLSITELIFLEDAFGDRMNTVFKLYFQVWALFAISAAVALPLAIRWVASHLGRPSSTAAASALGIVILGAALYPPISAYHWTNGFSHFSGIDGLAYLQTSAPNEMSAITWLQSNAQPTDHILEAPGCSYGEDGVLPDNVFSMATGLQTPLGWQFHEYQWRLGTPSITNEINQRKADVKTIYDAPTSPLARTLLTQYGIKFIVVGPIEQNGYGTQCDGGAPYAASGLAELNQLGWPVAYRNADVKIYERP